jgi:hypothetical protein
MDHYLLTQRTPVSIPATPTQSSDPANAPYESPTQDDVVISTDDECEASPSMVDPEVLCSLTTPRPVEASSPAKPIAKSFAQRFMERNADYDGCVPMADDTVHKTKEIWEKRFESRLQKWQNQTMELDTDDLHEPWPTKIGLTGISFAPDEMTEDQRLDAIDHMQKLLIKERANEKCVWCGKLWKTHLTATKLSGVKQNMSTTCSQFMIMWCLRKNCKEMVNSTIAADFVKFSKWRREQAAASTAAPTKRNLLPAFQKTLIRCEDKDSKDAQFHYKVANITNLSHSFRGWKCIECGKNLGHTEDMRKSVNYITIVEPGFGRRRNSGQFTKKTTTTTTKSHQRKKRKVVSKQEEVDTDLTE